MLLLTNNIPDIVIGDDKKIKVTLYKEYKKFVISPTAIVKASIVSKDNKKIYIPEIVVDINAEGSDWNLSTIIVKFSQAQTSLISFYTDYLYAVLEIQVEETNNITTWISKVKILKGTIT